MILASTGKKKKPLGIPKFFKDTYKCAYKYTYKHR